MYLVADGEDKTLPAVKRDFESLSSKPYASLSLELGEDKPDHLGPGVVIITMR